ncbi:MAG: hypothetical protein BWY96_01050 [Spirochaetes bacterium ADurb.BinA120]|nr:MAG: hypothetical protein BWY96_01050 [Spirochaetes bacterium ADurb.BinA120]
MVRGASRYWDAIERFDAHQTATSLFLTCDKFYKILKW